MKISQTIKEIITKDETGYIEIKRGKGQTPLKYNRRQIINKINCYLNDQFLEREDGLFWNISTPRITHFSKLISPDTKDFMPYGIGELNYWQSWALRKKLREWFDDNAFYKVLNDASEGLATYGSVVWKKCKDDKGKVELEEVNLLNLYFDQSVECINDTSIVEKHFLSKQELWEKDGVWENVQDLIKQDLDEYEINEFWGYVDRDDNGKLVHEYKHIIVFGEGENEIMLWDEKTDEEECPYVDFHLGRFRGRWMRVGVVERLFKLQARVNELVNQNAQATAIASLLLLKSASPDATGNVLEQAENGQILADESLQQIGITNVGLTAFIQEMALLSQQADKLCLTPEIIQGEASPTNTTFRGIAVVNAGAVTAFKNFRQDFFEKIAHILMTDILPYFVEQWKKEDVLELAEDESDIEEYVKAVQMVMEKDALLNGTVITDQVKGDILNTIESQIKGTRKAIEIPKGFWNFKYGIKMTPTDETVDKNAKNDAYFNALQMTGANPAITTVPGFKQYLEDNGISPWKLTPKQIEQLQPQATNQMPEPKQPDKLLSAAKQLS